MTGKEKKHIGLPRPRQRLGGPFGGRVVLDQDAAGLVGDPAEPGATGADQRDIGDEPVHGALDERGEAAQNEFVAPRPALRAAEFVAEKNYREHCAVSPGNGSPQSSVLPGRGLSKLRRETESEELDGFHAAESGDAPARANSPSP